MRFEVEPVDAPLPAGMGVMRSWLVWGIFSDEGDLLVYGWAKSERRAKRKARKWLTTQGITTRDAQNVVLQAMGA